MYEDWLGIADFKTPYEILKLWRIAKLFHIPYIAQIKKSTCNYFHMIIPRSRAPPKEDVLPYETLEMA